VATFVLIPGAGGDAWQWHLVIPELQARGHRTLAVDLPADDDTAGLPEYADTVVHAVHGLELDDRADRAERADRADLVVVASSLGGFTAPWWWRGCRCGRSFCSTR
jgi:pimeloyl-ACP methyl ester carboxylesterase